jgi:hypothetical protein
MLTDKKSNYFEIIREDVFDEHGELVYDDFVEEFEPYAVTKKNAKYANYGAIQLLEFGMKSKRESLKGKKDKKFKKRYEQTKEHISNKVFATGPMLETHVSDNLSCCLISPMLRNLTYGESTLSVWIHEGETYVLVNAGQGESACNLLFFCRVENKGECQ